jgi:WD40 repeat protein
MEFQFLETEKQESRWHLYKVFSLSIDLKGHKGAVWDCKLSRDSTVCVTGSADFTAKVWETHSSTVLCSYEHKHIVKTVDLSVNHQYLLTAGHEKKVNLMRIHE